MEEVSVLIGRSQSGDKEAREVLIEKNLGLVHHIVKRFLGRGYDPEDLFQIGYRADCTENRRCRNCQKRQS